MYDSLEKVCKDFKLFIFCFDEKAFTVLSKMNLQKVVLVKLEEFETPELLEIKSGRTKAEYCWTSTPFVIRHAVDKYELSEVTYLDSDIYFYCSPEAVFSEFAESGASVLITEHRFSQQYKKFEKFGKYCVQFVTFKADELGLKILQWWQDRCIEWCYNRYEDGKFGDQKYLDAWPEKFQGVHVLKHPGGGVAPWNVQQYEVYLKNGRVILQQEDEHDLIFYHFQNLRFYTNNFIEIGNYRLDKNVINLLYKPYVRHLEIIKLNIASVDSSFDPHGTDEFRIKLSDIPWILKRKIKKTYNYYSKEQFRRI